MACRGGTGSCPIGLKDLELVIAALNQADDTTSLDTLEHQVANPFRSPVIGGLRKYLVVFLNGHAKRTEVLLRYPRRVSNPRRAWKEQCTILAVKKTDRNGKQRERRESFHAPFSRADVDYYVHHYPYALIRELLERGDDQPIKIRELSRLLHTLTLECRFLYGCDISWVALGSESTGDIPTLTRSAGLPGLSRRKTDSGAGQLKAILRTTSRARTAASATVTRSTPTSEVTGPSGHQLSLFCLPVFFLNDPITGVQVAAPGAANVLL